MIHPFKEMRQQRPIDLEKLEKESIYSDIFSLGLLEEISHSKKSSVALILTLRLYIQVISLSHVTTSKTPTVLLCFSEPCSNTCICRSHNYYAVLKYSFLFLYFHAHCPVLYYMPEWSYHFLSSLAQLSFVTVLPDLHRIKLIHKLIHFFNYLSIYLIHAQLLILVPIYINWSLTYW